MKPGSKAMDRLQHLKRELDSLYFTAEYERLKNVIDGIRMELERKRRRA